MARLNEDKWNTIMHCLRTGSHTVSELAKLHNVSPKAIYKKLAELSPSSKIIPQKRNRTKISKILENVVERSKKEILEQAAPLVLKPLEALGPLIEEGTIKNIQSLLDILNKGEIEMVEKEQVVRNNVVIPNSVKVRKTVRKLTPKDHKEIQDTFNKIGVVFGYIKTMLPEEQEHTSKSNITHLIDFEGIYDTPEFN